MRRKASKFKSVLTSSVATISRKKSSIPPSRKGIRHRAFIRILKSAKKPPPQKKTSNLRHLCPPLSPPPPFLKLKPSSFTYSTKYDYQKRKKNCKKTHVLCMRGLELLTLLPTHPLARPTINSQGYFWQVAELEGLCGRSYKSYLLPQELLANHWSLPGYGFPGGEWRAGRWHRRQWTFVLLAVSLL